MKKNLLILGIFFAWAALITGCSKKDNTSPNTVIIQNMAFNPATVTVAANTTITWTNKDNVTHNVTSDSGWFASGNISPNTSFSQLFSKSGTYTYSCTIHPNMHGTVIVQ